jgi:hypothetical protein
VNDDDMRSFLQFHLEDLQCPVCLDLPIAVVNQA